MSTPDCVLSTREFDVLWGDLGLGRKPYPLDVPSVGRTVEERARLADEVYRDLGDRGLASGRRPTDELAGLLRLLDRHDVAADAVGHIGRPLRAIAAADQDSGVLAALGDDELWLAGIRPASLARSIVEVLPFNDAGPGRAMTVPFQALAAAVDPDAGDDNDPFADDDNEQVAMIRAGMSADDAAALAELANNRVAGGQFGVSHGARRWPVMITWFDTHQGRYLMVREDSWLSLAPANNQRIEQRVASVLSAATEN